MRILIIGSMILLVSCVNLNSKNDIKYVCVVSANTKPVYGDFDSTVFYLNFELERIDSGRSFKMIDHQWHNSEKISHLPNNDRESVCPFIDSYGLFEIMNINLGCSDYNKLIEYSDSIELRSEYITIT
jgi:hypothetical protein